MVNIAKKCTLKSITLWSMNNKKYPMNEEQKAVRDTKLYTYKNITNIDVDNELASIDVEYKKDPTLEHDDLQNQIDELKQLISTTETSALLLDNLQKDVESEVE